MKKTDIALIIIIISASAGISWWVADMTIGKANDEPIMVKVTDEITQDEAKVDEAVFAKDAINPTVEVSISGEDLTSFIDDTTDTEGTEGNESADPEGVLPDADTTLPVGE